jgi:hypothetical protein
MAPPTGVKPVTCGSTVNLVEVANPSAVVTVIGPLVALFGTRAVMVEVELVSGVTGVPLKVTSVALARVVPVIVTVWPPNAPASGVKPVMAGSTANRDEVAVPLGVTTAIGPLVALAGTVAVIWLSESTEKPGAFVPLNRTAVAPVKLLPASTTWAPAGAPPAGEKEVIPEDTVKFVEVVTPSAVVTVMMPEVAPAGTVVVIWLAEGEKTGWAVPLKLTAVVPARFVPLIVTAPPTGAPPGGVKPVMWGRTVNLVEVAVPSAVVTEIGPLVALAGTMAVIVVGVFVEVTAAVPLKETAVALASVVPVMVTV